MDLGGRLRLSSWVLTFWPAGKPAGTSSILGRRAQDLRLSRLAHYEKALLEQYLVLICQLSEISIFRHGRGRLSGSLIGHQMFHRIVPPWDSWQAQSSI